MQLSKDARVISCLRPNKLSKILCLSLLSFSANFSSATQLKCEPHVEVNIAQDLVKLYEKCNVWAVCSATHAHGDLLFSLGVHTKNLKFGIIDQVFNGIAYSCANRGLVHHHGVQSNYFKNLSFYWRIWMRQPTYRWLDRGVSYHFPDGTISIGQTINLLQRTSKFYMQIDRVVYKDWVISFGCNFSLLRE